MIDFNVREAIPNGALNISRLWIQCTVEVARLELASVTQDSRPKKCGHVMALRLFCTYFQNA